MSKVLTAYFSASGSTAHAAEALAKAAGTDIFEIVPEQAYTADDLRWTDKNSRSSLEMADKGSRPAIESRVENMEQYDVIFLGFPIWWYREPSIIDTFLESYDLSGKKIVPFCTSGSSGIGTACESIAEIAKGAKVLDGKRFSFMLTEKDLKKWVNDIINNG